jgi:UDP-glucose 4-epimerase
MRKILLTGGAGLLGSHLLPLLAQDEVHTLGRCGDAAARDNVIEHEIDLSEPINTTRLPERIDATIYLAQSRRFREFPGGAADMLQVNATQVQRLLDHAVMAGASHFIYASTGSVYAPAERPFAEDDALLAPGKLGFYPASKLCGEAIVSCYAPLLTAVILRPFFIYGPGQNRSMLIPRLIDSVREGRPISLQGDDGLLLNPVHAQDAAAATQAALRLRESNIVNIAGPEATSIRAICEAAGRAFDSAPAFERSGDASPSFVASIERMANLLGAPTRRIDDAIATLA